MWVRDLVWLSCSQPWKHRTREQARQSGISFPILDHMLSCNEGPVLRNAQWETLKVQERSALRIFTVHHWDRHHT